LFTGCDFFSKTYQLDQKRFIYERDLKISHCNMARTRKAREHWDGRNDKLKKMTNLTFTKKRFICYNVSLYMCLFLWWGASLFSLLPIIFGRVKKIKVLSEKFRTYKKVSWTYVFWRNEGKDSIGKDTLPTVNLKLKTHITRTHYDIYIYIYMYIHTQIYIYIYIYMCIDSMKKHNILRICTSEDSNQKNYKLSLPSLFFV